MTKNRPDYYCPVCQEYCKDIIEVYDNVFEHRAWNEDCYELQSSDFDNNLVRTICYKCYMYSYKMVDVIESDRIINVDK